MRSLPGSERCNYAALEKRALTETVVLNSDEFGIVVVTSLVPGGGPLSDLSLCLLREPDFSGQQFLCGHQSSGE